MTPDDFRRLALALPEATQGSHMGHVDFRIRGKIFATVGYPDETCGMVRLTQAEQEARIAAEPAMFRPVKGPWGARGDTNVLLAAADEAAATGALTSAWLIMAPTTLARAFREGRL